MTICTECKTKLPSLASRVRKVNSELYQLGLEYHDMLSYSLNAVDRILVKHGFREQAGESIVPGLNGRQHVEVGEGKWLSMSWYRLPASGRYEVVAYVN